MALIYKPAFQLALSALSSALVLSGCVFIARDRTVVSLPTARFAFLDYSYLLLFPPDLVFSSTEYSSTTGTGSIMDCAFFLVLS